MRATEKALRRGQIADAAGIVASASKRYPSHPGVLLASARVHHMRGEPEQALQNLQELLRADQSMDVDRRHLLGVMGNILFEQGRFGEAVPYLQQGRGETVVADHDAKVLIVAELPFERREIDPGGVELPLLDTELAAVLCTFGDKQRPLVLDTGSTRTTLTWSLAKELRVEHATKAGLGHDSLGNQFAIWLGVLPAFTLGASEIGPIPVSVVEDERLRLRDLQGGPSTPPEGVVGLDVLSQCRTVFDPKRKSVTFEASRGLTEKDSVRCVFYEGAMLLPADVENVRMWFILDTGASHSSLTEQGLQALPGGERRAQIDHRRHRTVGGSTVVVKRVQVQKLRVSAVQFGDVQMSVVRRPLRDEFPVHGVLGADLLLRCRLTVDGNRVLATFKK